MMKNKNSLLYLAKFLKAYKVLLALVFLALVFSSFSVLGIGYSIRFLIDNGFASGDLQILNKAISIVLIVIVVLSIASYVRSLLIDSICEKVIADIRNAVYAKLIYISPSYYELQKTSDIISRLTNDTTLIHSVIANVFSFLLRNSIMTIGGIIMLYLTSPKLTLYVLAILPVVIIPIIIIGKKVRSLSKLTQEKIGLVSAHLEESFNAIKTVQSYTRENFEIKKFSNGVNDVLQTALKRIRLRSLLVGLVIFMISVAVTYVLWIGGNDILEGRISSGNLASFLYYAVLVASSIGGISEVATDLSKAAGAADRICSLLFVESEIADNKNLKAISDCTISFNKVRFSYPSRPDTQVLNGLSFTASPGAKIAIVGTSGAGKSTIFQLLLRFYNCNSGSITIGQNDIKGLSLEELRGNIALVTQEPVIFSASAYDNILYGNPKASKEEVVRAAKLAEIYDFLVNLPEGLDSFLGEKGIRLSGGQKQRISIARAILKDPKILLLDEATNSLDSQNEDAVQKALNRFMASRTSIIIAHRLTTIIDVDQILVLDQGAIVESGTHQQLLANSNLYSKLIKKYYDQSV